MEKKQNKIFKFPLSYIWSSACNCAVTNDGGLVYIGSKSVNYISPIENEDDSPNIETLNTRQNLICLDVDPGWGTTGPDKPEKFKKYVAVLGNDRSIQIWNFANGKAVSGHKVHHVEGGIVADGFNINNANVLMKFMKNRNVLSLDLQKIVNYCIASNTYYTTNNFLPKRFDSLTTLECSPYDEEIFALGTSTGTIYLCNLQTKTILYTLKGHKHAIASMKFIHHDRSTDKDVKIIKNKDKEMKTLREADENIVVALKKSGMDKGYEKDHEKKEKEKEKEENLIEKKQEQDKKQDQENEKQKQKQKQSKKLNLEMTRQMGAACDDFVDIYDYNYSIGEFGTPLEVKEEQGSSDFVGIEKPTVTPEFDFKEACQALKQEMEVRNNRKDSVGYELNEVTLEECKNISIRCPSSPSCSDQNEGMDSSLEMINNKNSSHDEDFDDTDGDIQHQVKCHADIHSTPPDGAPDELINSDRSRQPSKSPVQSMSRENSNSPEPRKTPDHHDLEKHSMLKCAAAPFDGQDNKENRDILLASTCAVSKLTLWHTGTGGHADSLFIASKKNEKISVSRHLCWLNPTTLLVSDKIGRLHCYELQSVRGTPTTYKLRGLSKNFNAHHVVQFRVGLGDLIWTMSVSRVVSLESFRTGKVLAKYGCVSSNISSIKENPDDMNKIALALSDRRLAVLDTSNLGPAEIQIENFSNGIDAAVNCVAWSADGTKLAFGTVEGRVGLINYAASRKKSVFNLDQVCGKAIFQIEWIESEVFVLCNSLIAIYPDDMTSKAGRIVTGIENVTSFSVRSPYLFVGTKDGKLEIYKRQRPSSLDFDLLDHFNIGQRFVSDMSWSYVNKNLLIVTCNCNQLAILEFNPDLGKAAVLQKVTGVTDVRAAFSQVRWSYSDVTKFITCGQDGRVCIWNTATCQEKPELVRYFPHPMLCAMFLPSDEHIILCSGKSGSLEMFDIRDKFTQTKPKKRDDPISGILWGSEAFKCTQLSSNEKRRQRRKKDTEQTEVEAPLDVEDIKQEPGLDDDNLGEANESLDVVNNKLKMLKVAGEPNLAEEDLNVSLQKAAAYYHKVPATVLCLIAKELNKKPLEKMLELLEIAKLKKSKESVLTRMLFGNREDAKALLEEELNNHRLSATKGAQYLFLPQLGGNLKEEIIKAITTKQLNEWLVSVAPTISYSFWQKVVEAFAQQLLEQGYTLQAASYLMALRKYKDAIQILLDGNMHKEAMLLAKIHLLPDDPLQKQIFDKWILFLEANGALYSAAFLCLVAEDFNRSYKLLARVLKRTPEVDDILAKMQAFLN